MKKFLVAMSISLMFSSAVLAADTYTGSFFETQQKKLDAQTNKIVNKEIQFNQKQREAMELRQKQQIQKRQQIEAQKQAIIEKQKAQQAFVEKKKQQIQAQKQGFKKQNQELKDLFSNN